MARQKSVSSSSSGGTSSSGSGSSSSSSSGSGSSSSSSGGPSPSASPPRNKSPPKKVSGRSSAAQTDKARKADVKAKHRSPTPERRSKAHESTRRKDLDIRDKHDRAASRQHEADRSRRRDSSRDRHHESERSDRPTRRGSDPRREASRRSPDRHRARDRDPAPDQHRGSSRGHRAEAEEPREGRSRRDSNGGHAQHAQRESGRSRSPHRSSRPQKRSKFGDEGSVQLPFPPPDRQQQQQQQQQQQEHPAERMKEQWGKQAAPEPQEGQEGQAKAPEQEPNFGLSGALAKETNTLRGVELLHTEPPEARKPTLRWRLYIFKNGELTGDPLYIHRQSCYLVGRERRVVDIPSDHPSCSKQHACLQFRLTEKVGPDGMNAAAVRPYMMDLGSTNGTFLNNERLEPTRYYELLEQDLIKFGNSTREYVLIHEKREL